MKLLEVSTKYLPVVQVAGRLMFCWFWPREHLRKRVSWGVVTYTTHAGIDGRGYRINVGPLSVCWFTTPADLTG